MVEKNVLLKTPTHFNTQISLAKGAWGNKGKGVVENVLNEEVPQD